MDKLFQHYIEWYELALDVDSENNSYEEREYVLYAAANHGIYLVED